MREKKLVFFIRFFYLHHYICIYGLFRRAQMMSETLANFGRLLIRKNDNPIPMIFQIAKKRRRRFCIITAVSRGFLTRFKLFPPSILTALLTVDTEIFFFLDRRVILSVGSFSNAFPNGLCIHNSGSTCTRTILEGFSISQTTCNSLH